MNKAELVEALAGKLGGSKADATKTLDAVLDLLKDTLAKGEEIKLPGFGSFEVAETAERTGRNPRTGEEIKIPAGKTPKFKAGAELKRAVAGA